MMVDLIVSGSIMQLL